MSGDLHLFVLIFDADSAKADELVRSPSIVLLVSEPAALS
jgi:hypothetical protein